MFPVYLAKTGMKGGVDDGMYPSEFHRRLLEKVDRELTTSIMAMVPGLRDSEVTGRQLC